MVLQVWGEITAIDLSSGDILWQRSNDDTPEGLAGISSALLTRTLLFHVNRGEAQLRAFDKRNGDHLVSLPLPARGTGAPMTYVVGGRQYIVVAVGAGDERNELVALSLPVKTDLPEGPSGPALLGDGASSPVPTGKSGIREGGRPSPEVPRDPAQRDDAPLERPRPM